MIKGIVVLVVCAFALVHADTYDSTTRRPPIEDVDYYNCTGQIEGSYEHPYDCTRFIQCANDRAIDMPCASCNNTERCPYGYTHWDSSLLRCNWPDETLTPCVNIPTPKPTEEPTTEEEVHPTPTKDEGVATTPGVTDAPLPTTTTTKRPDEETTPGQPGDACDPEDCNVRGDCRSYRFCRRTVNANVDPDEQKGELVEGECGDHLWFNPQANSSAVHGGTCDNWANLPIEIREEYERECVCNFFAVGNCSPLYIYQDANPKGSDNWENQTLSCPTGLNWNQAKRTCTSEACSL